MPTQMAQFFLDPKDLCKNYVTQSKQVVDFRSHQNVCSESSLSSSKNASRCTESCRPNTRNGRRARSVFPGMNV
ncbi:hypothetical protein L596_002634 [Steinernema carpocapsae]|nr:hypothetical protein L596_002634 [Steinernema carpocapsae]